MRVRQISHHVLPISGGMLFGIAVFWILPEMRELAGWPRALLWAISIFLLLLVIDRKIFPICPCCGHRGCTPDNRPALGFVPLIGAIVLHNIFDGWTIALSNQVDGVTKWELIGGVLAHKLPEALIFGLMLSMATKKREHALLAALITASGIGIGAAGQALVVHSAASALGFVSLALAEASFLFAGVHLFLRHRRDSGLPVALASSGVGATLAILMQVAIAR